MTLQRHKHRPKRASERRVPLGGGAGIAQSGRVHVAASAAVASAVVTAAESTSFKAVAMSSFLACAVNDDVTASKRRRVGAATRALGERRP